jgi:hypothetical protein
VRLFDFFRKSSPKPEPVIESIPLEIKDIPGAIELVDGFPRVDWSKVRDAANRYADHPGLDALWSSLAADWLDATRDHLGGDYDIYESDHLLLLSADGLEHATRLLNLGDAAYDRLERILQRSAKERGVGKHAVLLLKTPESYYRYLSYFYSERDQTYTTSAGVHLRKGYRHTVINGKSNSAHRTLVHELAHDMVCHRPLPAWLNEGLAQSVEDMVPGYRPPLINHRRVRLHQRYWSWFGIQHFWNGRAFSSIGSQRLSYELSEILFRNLINTRSRQKHLVDFLALADRKDAGESASLQCFGCPLAELVAEFLGPGPWDVAAINPE